MLPATLSGPEDTGQFIVSLFARGEYPVVPLAMIVFALQRERGHSERLALAAIETTAFLGMIELEPGDRADFHRAVLLSPSEAAA